MKSPTILIALVFVSVAASISGRSVTAQRIVRAWKSPAHVDLRSEFAKYGISVRHQGKRGSCQVFATVGVIEYELAKRGERVDLSEQFLMWAANSSTGRDRIDGFFPEWLIKGIKRYGIAEENSMPYVPRKTVIESPTKIAIDEAASRQQFDVHTIKNRYSKLGFNERQLEEIRSLLRDRKPVTVTICWPKNLNNLEIIDSRFLIVDKNIKAKSKSGHGVILVGFRIHDSYPGGGYFIIRNSWGPRFADQGHARVTFEFARKYGIDAYRVVPK